MNEPTDKYNRQISNIVKNNKTIDKKDKNKYLQSNPKAPKLKALIKLHEENHPIRPLVNFVTAPSYFISKYIKNQLTTKLNLSNTYNIKNNHELLEKLHNITVTENTKIMSFDIKNLYTNIPVPETLNIIKNKIKNDLESINLINDLKIILSQNYFQFNNKFYNMKDGLAMGSPLSSIISETFLQEYENKTVENLKAKYNIITWIRYVDDILCIVEENIDISDEILNTLNTQHPNLQYTLERESNNSISFLDIKITKNYTNKKFDFTIHRKETSTNTIINKKSQHPIQHKIAAITALTNRMKIVSKYTETKEEIITIKEIVHANGYNTDIIRRIMNKQKKTEHKTDDNRQWATFVYHDEDTYKITNILSKYVKISFRTTNHIYNLLPNNIEKINKYEQSGIYSLECPTCKKLYIGMTKRKYKTRYEEHRKAYIFPDVYKSAYATHIIKEQHEMGSMQTNMKTFSLHQKQNKQIMEQIHIQENLNKGKHLINDQLRCTFSTLLRPLEMLNK